MIKLKNNLIAHRGVFNNINIPENSLLAFKKAIDMNLPIELDVLMTLDGKLIVFHDYNLSRMTNKDLFCEYLTYEEINKMHLLETKEKIPTLLEVLNLVNGKVFLDIEIKSNHNYKKVCQEVLKYLDNYRYDFLIQSFNPKIIKWFRKNRPSYITGFVIMNKSFFITKLLISYCKPKVLVVYKKSGLKRFYQKLREKYLLILWTIKKENELEKYKDHADCFICNNIQYYVNQKRTC